MANKLVTAEEIREHNKNNDLWLVVDGKVYDMTDFALIHPGGSAVIYQYAGKDATIAYSEIHAPSLIERSLHPSKHVGHIDASTKLRLRKEIEEDISKESGSYPAQSNATSHKRPELDEIINLFDFEDVARQFLTPKTLAYWGGASNDCITHQSNRSMWEKVILRPHLLKNVTTASTKTRMLGYEFDLPLFTSPFGLAKLAHRDGELNIARATVESGVTMCYSTYASFPFSDTMMVVPNDYPIFFQLYINKDRSKTESMIKQVTNAGAKAIFITIDLPVVGKRESDERIRGNVIVTSGNAKTSSQISDKKGHGLARTTASDIDPSFCWEDLAWVKSITHLPIVLKGIQTAADARKAMEVGCDAIFLSNHGGRAVDTAPASLLILLELHVLCPEIFQKMEVYIDGGIRRGTDILKAICLGATAIGLGRPVLYSNMYGQEGVSHMISILKDELETAMQQCGLTSLADASPKYLNTSEIDHLVMKSDQHLYARHVSRAKL